MNPWRVISLVALIGPFASACGSSEPENPYAADSTGGAERITATSFSLEHKVLGKGADSSFIIGTDKPLDLELWLYDQDGHVVGRFPMKWRILSYGVSLSIWGVLKNIPKMRNFAGKSARSILGSFTGTRHGIAAIAGQTSMKASNGDGVDMRIIFDRIGAGIDLSFVKILSISGTIPDEGYSWDTIIDVPEPGQNW